MRPIAADLLQRINLAAEAEGLSQAQFVIEVMENETKDMKPVVEARQQRRNKRREGAV